MTDFIFGQAELYKIVRNELSEVGIQLVINIHPLAQNAKTRLHHVDIVLTNSYSHNIVKYWGSVNESNLDSINFDTAEFDSLLSFIDTSFGVSNLDQMKFNAPGWECLCHCSKRSKSLYITEHVGNLDTDKYFRSFVDFTKYVMYRVKLHESVFSSVDCIDNEETIKNGEKQIELIEELEDQLVKQICRLYKVPVNKIELSDDAMTIKTDSNSMILSDTIYGIKFNTLKVLDITSYPEDIELFADLLNHIKQNNFITELSRYFKMRKHLVKFIIDNKITSIDERYVSEKNSVIGTLVSGHLAKCTQLNSDTISTVISSTPETRTLETASMHSSSGFAHCKIVTESGICEYYERIAHKNLESRLFTILSNMPV